MNYVIGMTRVPYSADTSHTYTATILKALDERITATDSMPVYTVLIYDRNGDGMPTKNASEDICAYYSNYVFVFPPAEYTLISNTVNTLPSTKVKFIGQTY